MLVTFTGDPRARTVKAFRASDPEALEIWGMRFPLNRPVTVTDEWWKQFGGKVGNNRHFHVGEFKAPVVTADEASTEARIAAAVAEALEKERAKNAQPAPLVEPVATVTLLGETEPKPADGGPDMAIAKGFGDEDFA